MASKMPSEKRADLVAFSHKVSDLADKAKAVDTETAELLTEIVKDLRDKAKKV